MSNNPDKIKLTERWDDMPVFFKGRILRNIIGGLVILAASALVEKGLGDFGKGFFAMGLLCLVYCLYSAGVTVFRAISGKYQHFSGVCVKAESNNSSRRVLLIRRKGVTQRVSIRLHDNTVVDLDCPDERPFLEGEYYDCYYGEATELAPGAYLGCSHRPSVPAI